MLLAHKVNQPLFLGVFTTKNTIRPINIKDTAVEGYACRLFDLQISNSLSKRDSYNEIEVLEHTLFPIL